MSAFWRSCALALCVAPNLASAANGNMPRTPALFPPHACLSVIDRTVDPTLAVAVHIPFEDTMVTPDELADSRQFSFVGLCRDVGRLEVLPNWITRDDAERALTAEIIDAPPDPQDVLFEASAWTQGHAGDDTCVQLIADDVPISCAATQDGVIWDASGVPAGNYVIRGYTFAPPSNLWTTRIGVVQVNDGTTLPVAALVSPVYDAAAFVEAGYRVLGCMDGPPGTMVSLQWAATAADNLADDAAWTEFAVLDATQRVIDLQFMMPPDTVYLGLLLRAVTTSADGSRWIGHAPGFITVYPGDGESDPPEVAPPPDHCAAGGDTSGGFDGATDTTGESTGSTSTGAADGDAAGCGCATDDHRGTWALGLWLLVGVRRRA